MKEVEIKFSIIIPIYNIENYVEKSIKSAINQTYTNVEIILVNDGSTDMSYEICLKYSEKDRRIKLINKEENEGLSEARNTGLNEAKGDYIIFLDGDDFIDLDTLERIEKIIKLNKGVEIIVGNIKDSQVGIKKLEKIYVKETEQIITGQEFLKKRIIKGTYYVSSCRNIYDRRFLIKNQLYFKKGILHEDHEWTPRVFISSTKVLETNITFYNVVVREGSITRNNKMYKNAVDLIETVKYLEKYYSQIEDESLQKLLKNRLVNTYLYAFQIGKLYKHKHKHLIDKKFLKRNAYTIKTKLKVRLFLISKRFYYIINKTKNFFVNKN